MDAVLKFVAGRDTFISMPTGSGKNVCFACTPIVFDRLRAYGPCTADAVAHHCITVIVSPLTALMQDQVSKFRIRGLKAAYVGGEEDQQYESIVNGDAQLVYLNPEAVLSQTNWREIFNTPCYHDNLVCLAVDEAHLVEKW